MQLRKSIYRAENNEVYEIFTRFFRPVPDISCQLLRFQIYFGDKTFACDTLISDRIIKQFGLSEKHIEEICRRKVCHALESNLDEYCSIVVGSSDIEL